MPPVLVLHALSYAAYFFAFGTITPYLPPYLRSQGLSATQVALLLSFAPFFTTFAPVAAGYLADRLRRTQLLMRAFAGVAALFFAQLLWVRSFEAILAVWFCYALCNSPFLPLLDASTMVQTVRLHVGYGRVRVWGSIGFMSAAFGVGAVFGGGLVAVKVALAAMAVLFLSVAVMPEMPVPAKRPTYAEARALLADRRLLGLLIAGAVHWVAMTPYHAFFAIHCATLGLPSSVAGQGMALGAFVEVCVMWTSPRALRDLPVGKTIALCSSASALRWLLTSYVTSAPLLIAVQSIHGLSFGAFYVAILAAAQRLVPEELRATGQGLLFSLLFGISSGLGTLVSGPVFDTFGGRVLFACAAGVSLVATALALRLPRF